MKQHATTCKPTHRPLITRIAYLKRGPPHLPNLCNELRECNGPHIKSSAKAPPWLPQFLNLPCGSPWPPSSHKCASEHQSAEEQSVASRFLLPALATQIEARRARSGGAAMLLESAAVSKRVSTESPKLKEPPRTPWLSHLQQSVNFAHTSARALHTGVAFIFS